MDIQVKHLFKAVYPVEGLKEWVKSTNVKTWIINSKVSFFLITIKVYLWYLSTVYSMNAQVGVIWPLLFENLLKGFESIFTKE